MNKITNICKRVLCLIGVFSVVAIRAIPQTLSVNAIKAELGEQIELVVSVEGATGMTAMQCTLTLPDGFSFAYVKGQYGICLGEATNEHMLSISNLSTGGRTIMVYSTDLNTFSDGVLFRIPVKVPGEECIVEGAISNVHFATEEAVDYECEGTSIVAEIKAAAVEPEPTPEPEGLSTSKYYRVKNVMTGLYLQVEGNNTNMKLQNKAEGLAMMQIFGLEVAEEGKYYIKAADADNRYYAHASGWNFNATTNADNKTPFTIALVEGEEAVYTLHQSVSTYTGLAGADASEAGSPIY